jgi:flagellar biogenesis protein FliO
MKWPDGKMRFAVIALNLGSMPVLAAGDTGTADASMVSSLIVTIALLLAAVAAATFFLRYWQGGRVGRDGPLKLIQVIALGPRERLALIKVGASYLVVGITPTAVTGIAKLDDTLDDVPGAPVQPGAAVAVARAIGPAAPGLAPDISAGAGVPPA